MPEPDLSEFYELVRSGAPCSIRATQDALAAEDRPKMETALNHASVTNAMILAWLRKRDIKVTSSALTAHRHKSCKCYRR